MKHLPTRLLTLLLVLGLCATGRAHEGLLHLMGTVASVSPSTLTVNTTTGETLTFTLSDDTEYSHDDVPATVQDLKVGQRIVVQYARAASGFSAAEIKLGVVKPLPLALPHAPSPGAGKIMPHTHQPASH